MSTFGTDLNRPIGILWLLIKVYMQNYVRTGAKDQARNLTEFNYVPVSAAGVHDRRRINILVAVDHLNSEPIMETALCKSAENSYRELTIGELCRVQLVAVC